ncbi:Alpha-ketoglutarate-dependent dioxygenase alkB like 6 [Pseudolycoriella hygida]|uniref:Alpha-ketoglutarate-dependent dioxygenase alkB like 6 n=1 Tax=Pseudolycoriella hygida TaxID=35572 RepID=A0A9Q0NEL3_9DIPT|nr:Alpha-ketoglutarate-dependent dioxygenase alkB like 6 [Pseudolycoriella hygida]
MTLYCPNTVIYIPNFITPSEEQNILTSVYNAPKPKWDQLTHRRLLNYGGVPHKNGMIAEVMPSWLQNYVDKINNLGIFDTQKANHVLVNEYLPKQGIMPHLDGPLFYPTITTISCGSHSVLEFFEANDENPEFSETLMSANESSSEQNGIKSARKIVCKLLIERRSLLILKDDMYHKYLHGIAEIDEDVISESVANLQHCSHSYKLGDKIKRETRVSLTIRHVPKTSKMKLKLGN